MYYIIFFMVWIYLIYLFPQQPYEVSSITVLILQMWKWGKERLNNLPKVIYIVVTIIAKVCT